MGKITILDLQKMKEEQKKVTMLTAYDYPTARILYRSGIDILLVGDSVGNVMLGLDNTLPVSIEDMIHHTRPVVKASTRAMVVIDMPFMSYQISLEDARKNAGKMIKESGAEAVKLEGGEIMEDTIKAIADIDIPVMAHIGLTPQSIHRMGGYRVQGKEEKQREKLMADALAVERAGAFSVVLEAIPDKLAEEITERLKIPTIGIGAGVKCDGQVLVVNDLLGLSGEFRPKFVKKDVNLEELISKAAKEYVAEVQNEVFPGEEHTFH